MLLALCFSLPVILAGAWYLANPTGVAPLAELEGQQLNRSRVRLRRFNGVLMLLAGIALYFVISRAIWLRDDPDRRAGLLLPIAVLALGPTVLAMIALTYLDIRLTRRLKRNIREAAKRLGQASAVGVAATLMLAVAVGCDEQAAPDDAPAATPTAPTPAAPSGNSARQTTVVPPNSRPANQPPADLPPPQELPTVTMTLAGEAFTLMVADDDDERRTGLMYRRDLAPDAGMLFVFDDDDWLSFHMKNTYVPLDLIFVSGRGRVVDIKQGQPLSLRSIPSSGRARYVIEIAAGRSRQIGLKKGDVLDMPDVVAEE